MPSTLTKATMTRPTTALAALALLATSLYGVLANPLDLHTILAQSWFICNVVASALCAAVHGLPDPSRDLMHWQETSNWFCGAVAMPFLTAYFLYEYGYLICSYLFQVIGLGITVLRLTDNLPSETEKDPNNTAPPVAALATIIATAICAISDNRPGLAAGLLLISSNLLMVVSPVSSGDKNKSGRLHPHILDAFLLGLAAANFFYAGAL